MEAQRITFNAPQTVQLEPFQLRSPGAGEALIQNEVTMISPGTERAVLLDLPNNPSSYPTYPGYSAAGAVLEVGPGVEALAPGDRVAYGGGHRSHAVVPAARLYPVPDDLATEQAVFVTLGAIALQGVRKARIELCESVLVVGLGMVGQLAAQLAAASGGLPVVGIDLDPFRRERAQAAGIRHVCDPGDRRGGELVEFIRAQNEGELFTVVIEATGLPQVVNVALEAARRRGRVIILGSTRGTSEINVYSTIHKQGLQVMGAHNSARPENEIAPGYWPRRHDEASVLKLLAAGRLKVRPLITHRVTPAEAVKLYDQLADWDTRLLGVQIDWT